MQGLGSGEIFRGLCSEQASLHTLPCSWAVCTHWTSDSSCHSTWQITLGNEACPWPLPPGRQEPCPFCTASEQITVTPLLKEGKNHTKCPKIHYVTDFFPSLILPHTQQMSCLKGNTADLCTSVSRARHAPGTVNVILKHGKSIPSLALCRTLGARLGWKWLGRSLVANMLSFD